MSEARRLRVLVIEDRERISGSELAKFLDIDICSGVKANPDLNAAGALDLLSEYRNISPRPSLDILIVDVDMSKDRALRGWEKDGRTTWDPSMLFRLQHQDGEGDGVPHELAPYGPILALPFISYASPLFVVQPVSAYWDAPAVYNNGFFLISMSLIATVAGRSMSGFITPEDVQRALRTRDLDQLGLAERSGTTLLEDGIRLSLAWLRRTMKDNFYFLGVEPAIEKISATLADYRSGAIVRADLLGALDAISIDLQCVGSSRADRVLLSSLFADMLVRRGRPPNEVLEGILVALKHWGDDENLNMRQLVKRLRTDIMDAIWKPGVRDAHAGDSAQSLVRQLNYDKQSAQFLAARRYVMLMAWTRAWYEYVLSGGKKKLKALAQEALGMGDNSNDWQRLALWGKDRAGFVDEHTHLHFLEPFWFVNGAAPAISDYYLDNRTGAQLRLSAFDRAVCRDYLGWLEKKKELPDMAREQLPAWLRDP